MGKSDPATKGDLEELATSFRDGIAELFGKSDDGDPPNKPPKKDDAGDPPADDDEPSFAFPKGWWGERGKAD